MKKKLLFYYQIAGNTCESKFVTVTKFVISFAFEYLREILTHTVC